MIGEQGERGVEGGAVVPGGTWARSWFFVRHVWALFRTDRAMQVVALLGVLATAAAAIALFGGFAAVAGYRRDHYLVSNMLFGTAITLPVIFVSTFLNVMLVAMAQARFEGGRMTVRDALAFAVHRLPAILGWALLAVGFGALMQLIAEKIPFAGRVLSFFGGVAWSLASMFVIPVLVVEGTGPLRATRRSVEVFRARWGEGVTGAIQVSALSLVLFLPGMIALALGLTWGGVGGFAIAAAGVALLATSLTMARALDELFALALYRHEVLGAGSFGMAASQLDAFVKTKAR